GTCLALKYVVYENSVGVPVINEEQVLANIRAINSVWSVCGIAFQVDDLVSTDPTDYGLRYNTATSSELNSIRRTYSDRETLLVVTTGQWSGSLGAGAANAWTMMPGGGIYGAILESVVARSSNLIAHELGH